MGKKKHRAFVDSMINIFSVTNLPGNDVICRQLLGTSRVNPFPKTQATPKSVYLNWHTNNDKIKIGWLGACQVEAFNKKN